MEIELDLSVTKSADNITFTSIKTEAVFLLLGHLPGFTQDKIEVSVNEAEKEICISGAGDKSSLETVVGRRLRLKNEYEVNSCRKVFRIPDGVVLDQIDVGFYEDEEILMILMPKSIKGEVIGREIQEVEVKQESPTKKIDEVIPKPEIDDAEVPKEKEVKEAEIFLKPNEAESSGSEDANVDRESKHMEAETKIHQQQREEEPPRKQPDLPEKQTIDDKSLDLDGEPPPPAASKPIEEEEEPIEKGISQHQPSEKEDETPKSIESEVGDEDQRSQKEEEEEETPKLIETEADQDFNQLNEAQAYPDHQQKQIGGEQKVPQSMEELKPDGPVQQPDQAPEAEMGKPIGAQTVKESEADISLEKEGKKEKLTPSKSKRTKREGGAGGGHPSLMVSAFLASLVALVYNLVRNRRSRQAL
ncbi:retinitis pigmentosa 1-like 1 protein isoform X2 [Canna indica]|uniref:Retinitis pigmentosa 1-like 1 protein isoform X2 n=1 Tax=Canna indica TaxID=4628 RepID=A0AAQ3KTM7_9LILI|nr:retinitis pigmentosa 1-like 1 protein isoform X2 [Canna indica]